MNGSWTLILGALALFGALFLLMASILGPRVRRRHLARELVPPTGTSKRSQMSAFGTKATELAGRALAHNDRERVLAAALERAGIDMRAPEFALLVVAGALGAAFVGLLISGILLAVIGAGLAVGGFVTYVNVKSTRRRKAFEDQLPEALALISGGLRAGHSLPQAIDALVQESDAPTCDEFRRVLFETQLGHPLTISLRGLAARIRSEDFDWVVQAIEIQREVGGDLAAVLDNVVDTIRDRTRVRRQIDTLTAEGRISAWVLLCLPIGMVVFMAAANPSYFGELTGSFVGNVMLVAGAGLMVAGALWLRRTVRLVY